MPEKQKRPLLLLHGFPLNAGMWRQTVDRFAKERTVVAPDVADLLASSPDSPSIEGMTEAAFRALEAAAPGQPAVVVGLSMGGYMAMEFARRYPDRLAALVLCDTRCQADTEEARRNRETMIAGIGSRGVVDGTKPLTDNLLSPGSAPEIHDEVRAMVARARPDVLIACVKALRDRRDYCSVLEGVRRPALVVRGSDDVIATKPVSEQMVQRLPNARLEEILSAAHIPPMEAPAAFSDILASFLAENEL